MLVGTAMNLIHHRRYAPCKSSLRLVVLVARMVSSVMWSSSRMHHALDHQVNLALEAIARCVRIAFWISGLGHSNR